MIVAAEPSTKSASTVVANGEPRVLLENVRWQTYDALCKDLDGQRVRMNYDQGRLEVMTISRLHEVYKWCLGRFFEIIAEELNLPFDVGGSMTFRREDLERGLELDECYWIQNEPRIRGKGELDFTIDPPPDLALEVEITHGLVSRLALLAALRVPEVWYFNQETLRVGILRADGTYHWQDHSPTFPQVPLAEIVRFLQQVEAMNRMELVRSFRAWVRQHLLPGQQNPNPAPPSA